MSIRGLWDKPPKASLHRKCGCETLLLGGISCLVPIREGWSIDGFPEDEAKKLALTQHSSKGCRAYFSNTWENSREKEEWGVLQSATRVSCRKSVTSASSSRFLLGCFSSPLTSEGMVILLWPASSWRQRGQSSQPAVSLPPTCISGSHQQT